MEHREMTVSIQTCRRTGGNLTQNFWVPKMIAIVVILGNRPYHGHFQVMKQV